MRESEGKQESEGERREAPSGQLVCERVKERARERGEGGTIRAQGLLFARGARALAGAGRLTRVEGVGCRVKGARCRVEGVGCRVKGGRCRVPGARCGV